VPRLLPLAAPATPKRPLAALTSAGPANSGAVAQYESDAFQRPHGAGSATPRGPESFEFTNFWDWCTPRNLKNRKPPRILEKAVRLNHSRPPERTATNLARRENFPPCRRAIQESFLSSSAELRRQHQSRRAVLRGGKVVAPLRIFEQAQRINPASYEMATIWRRLITTSRR